MKNTLLLTYSANILVRLLTVNMKNCLTPKITKCATPFLTSNCIENASFSVVLMSCKVNFHVVRSPLQNSVCWPHYRHYRRKNAAPSSGTSPFGSYKEVLPPPPHPPHRPCPGEASLIFTTPSSTIFGVRESWCTENCSVNRKLSKSSIVYTWIEDQLKKINR